MNTRVRQMNAARKPHTPLFKLQVVYSQDQYSRQYTRLLKKLGAENVLVLIPVPWIPKDRMLHPFKGKPEFVSWPVGKNLLGVEFHARRCGKKTRDRVARFARQITQWAAYCAARGVDTRHVLPWHSTQPLGLDEYYFSPDELKLRNGAPETQVVSKNPLVVFNRNRRWSSSRRFFKADAFSSDSSATGEGVVST
jgi:hypothetical protein